MDITKNEKMLQYLLDSVIVRNFGSIHNAVFENHIKFISENKSTTCAFVDKDNSTKFFNAYSHKLLLSSEVDSEYKKLFADDAECVLLERLAFTTFQQFLSLTRDNNFDVIFEIADKYYQFSNSDKKLYSVVECKLISQKSFIAKNNDLSYHISDFEKLCAEKYISAFKIVKL